MTARAAADGVLAEMLIKGDRVSIRPASAGDLLPLQRIEVPHRSRTGIQ